MLCLQLTALSTQRHSGLNETMINIINYTCYEKGDFTPEGLEGVEVRALSDQSRSSKLKLGKQFMGLALFMGALSC